MDRTPPEPKPILLIIDDDPDQLVLFRLAAERTGFYWRVETATNGALAYEHIFRWAEQVPRFVPRVVLTDLRMPRIDGVDFVRRLRADPLIPPLHFVAMSSTDYGPEVDSALNAGCCAFVQKPENFAKLGAFFRDLPEICGLQGASTSGGDPDWTAALVRARVS